MSKVTREFDKEFLQRMAYEDIEESEGELLDTKIIDTSRWSVIQEMTFRADDGLVYKSQYSVGATECQDESPYEYADNVIKCAQYELKEVLVKKYVPVTE